MKRPQRRLAAFVAMAGIAFAGGAGVSAVAQQAATPPAASLFQDQASKLGARRCASLFAAMGNTVVHGAAHGVQTQVEPAAPDGHGVQGLVGMTYNTPDYSGQAAGIVLAAPIGEKCEGQLVRVAPFQRTCQNVVALLPAGSTRAGMLSGVPLYNLGGNQGQALLVQSGGACVVVTVAQGRDVR